MSLPNRTAPADQIWKSGPLAQVIEVLRKQRTDTIELQGRLDEVRTNLKEECEPKIRVLLNGLVSELKICSHLLDECLKALSADPALDHSRQTEAHSHGRSFGGHGTECREQLDLLLSRYAQYAMTTVDSIAILDPLGDEAAIGALNWIMATTKKGLWFIGIYVEGLALQMDFKRLPEWPHSSTIVDASPFN